MKFLKIIIVCCFVLCANSAFALTMFSFDSSQNSWVGQGESVYVMPEDGYLFKLWSSTLNHVSICIFSLNSPFGPEWAPSSGEDYNYWFLDLAAPFNDPLEVGFYDDTARYPFQDDDQPGLTLSGNHRGNNRNGGFFEISEIAFDENNVLTNLSVDFTQYGEEQESRWITGSLRYNSNETAPVPEPTTLALLGLGIVGIISQRKIKKSW